MIARWKQGDRITADRLQHPVNVLRTLVDGVNVPRQRFQRRPDKVAAEAGRLAWGSFLPRSVITSNVTFVLMKVSRTSWAVNPASGGLQRFVDDTPEDWVDFIRVPKTAGTATVFPGFNGFIDPDPANPPYMIVSVRPGILTPTPAIVREHPQGVTSERVWVDASFA